MEVVRAIAGRKNLKKQFLEAQKMEAIGIQVVGLAHDLSNLLTGIKSFSDFMMMDLEQTDPLRHDAASSGFQPPPGITY